jgi:hypothetical protein
MPSGRDAGKGSAPREGSLPPHLWQVPEADEELATLAPTLRHLRGKVARLSEVKEELERLATLWGDEFDAPDHPDVPRKKELESQLTALHGEIEGELSGWRDRGIEVKDLATGIVDFYALRKGEIICLCWKMGEEGVRHWHTLEGGFRTRRPLSDAERQGGLDRLPEPGSDRVRSPP